MMKKSRVVSPASGAALFSPNLMAGPANQTKIERARSPIKEITILFVKNPITAFIDGLNE
jgi:hypothetical protein